MMIKHLGRWLSTGLLALTLAACETTSLKAPGAEKGTGSVTDFSLEPNTRVALYKEAEMADGKQPELTYGSMDAYFVTIDDVTYMVHYDDQAEFKSLKKGDKIAFKATGDYARKEKNGQNYRVILLNEM